LCWKQGQLGDILLDTMTANLLKSTLQVVRAGCNWLRGGQLYRSLAARGEAPIPILFYHRVAADALTPLTITPQRFARHIRFLRKRFQVIDLAQAQQHLRQRTSNQRFAAITFDDGYADNNAFALPLLVEHQLPCTYFVSIDNVNQQIPFPHDLEMGFQFAPNSIDDLRRWSAAGIEIGLHTRTHFDFSKPHDQQTIDSEIISAAAELTEWLGKPPRFFAFPYGLVDQISPHVVAALKQLGMLGYCSAYGAYNLPTDDLFHIRRVHGDHEMARFWNWMMLDPEKLRKQQRESERIGVSGSMPAALAPQVCSTPGQ